MWSCAPTEPGALPSGTVLRAAWLNPDWQRFRTLWSTLSTDERRRADRFQVARDRSRFVAARGMLRILLAQCLGAEPADLEFDYTSSGKPSLTGDWASAGLQFNLSHSGDLALFAVAILNPVGVDVEESRPLPNLAALMELILSPREAGELDGLSGEEKERTFLRIWTRKEAWLKATGIGVAGMPVENDDSAELKNAAPIRLFPESPAVPGCRIYDLMPAPGFFGALAMVDQ
jgi:4'-phosphopantetheinyl transferase